MKRIQFAVPASVEFLVNPNYRIFFDNDQINEQLYPMRTLVLASI